MRFTQTFVLHLYVDSEALERLCGNVRPLENPESFPFKNQLELEELLRRLIGKPPTLKVASPGADTCPEL